MTRPLSHRERQWVQLVETLQAEFDLSDETVRRVFNEFRSTGGQPTVDQLRQRLAEVHWRERPAETEDDLRQLMEEPKQDGEFVYLPEQEAA